nr:hypothetical protein CFP56_00487 [Quercus suber]
MVGTCGRSRTIGLHVRGQKAQQEAERFGRVGDEEERICMVECGGRERVELVQVRDLLGLHYGWGPDDARLRVSRDAAKISHVQMTARRQVVQSVRSLSTEDPFPRAMSNEVPLAIFHEENGGSDGNLPQHIDKRVKSLSLIRALALCVIRDRFVVRDFILLLLLQLPAPAARLAKPRVPSFGREHTTMRISLADRVREQEKVQQWWHACLASAAQRSGVFVSVAAPAQNLSCMGVGPHCLGCMKLHAC